MTKEKFEQLKTRIYNEGLISVKAHNEDLHPKDHFDECFADEVKRIVEESEWNEWAWCVAELKLTWQGITSSEYLGGCSYDNEKSFLESCGEDLRWQASHNIAMKVARILDAVGVE